MDGAVQWEVTVGRTFESLYMIKEYASVRGAVQVSLWKGRKMCLLKVMGCMWNVLMEHNYRLQIRDRKDTK
jgi:phage-related protein